MQRFSQRLEDLLDREGWTRTKLAELCGVDLSNVARWRSGKALPKRHVLDKLIRVVNEHDASDLLTAWILDSLPDGADGFITVRPRQLSSKVAERPESDNWPEGISVATRRKFVDFARLAMSNGDVMEIVDVLHAAAMRMKKGKG